MIDARCSDGELSPCCSKVAANDERTLEALMRGFVECRIKPYYLHHGDLAPGTAHLRTTLKEGRR